MNSFLPSFFKTRKSREIIQQEKFNERGMKEAVNHNDINSRISGLRIRTVFP